jgi:hypothetical protein
MKIVSGVIVGVVFFVLLDLITALYTNSINMTDLNIGINFLLTLLIYVISFAILYALDTNIIKVKKMGEQINGIINAAIAVFYIVCVWIIGAFVILGLMVL